MSTVYVTAYTYTLQLPNIPCSHSCQPNNCDISLIGVENSLSSLNNVKSAGPDGLLGMILFNSRSAIFFLSWLIFYRSLKHGIFHHRLK